MRLGEARDEAFLAHLPSTYDLARRGGKILGERQEALDAANAKKAFNERLVAREDPAVVAACRKVCGQPSEFKCVAGCAQ